MCTTSTIIMADRETNGKRKCDKEYNKRLLVGMFAVSVVIGVAIVCIRLVVDLFGATINDVFGQATTATAIGGSGGSGSGDDVGLLLVKFAVAVVLATGLIILMQRLLPKDLLQFDAMAVLNTPAFVAMGAI